jgi:ABC-type Fe3+/spermidine/putrescine transport system ATPase subunit
MVTRPATGTNSNPVLRLDGIVKRYGATTALGPIEIAVEKGELLTLLGPSGCGKTTTLHIIAVLTQPTEGHLYLAGREITRLAPPYRDVGLVFQNYALFPHRTVAQNVAFGLRMRKVPKSEIGERARRMLEVVGLAGVEERLPHQLSGGQRQRVALAAAWSSSRRFSCSTSRCPISTRAVPCGSSCATSSVALASPVFDHP